MIYIDGVFYNENNIITIGEVFSEVRLKTYSITSVYEAYAYFLINGVIKIEKYGNFTYDADINDDEKEKQNKIGAGKERLRIHDELTYARDSLAREIESATKRKNDES